MYTYTVQYVPYRHHEKKNEKSYVHQGTLPQGRYFAGYFQGKWKKLKHKIRKVRYISRSPSFIIYCGDSVRASLFDRLELARRAN